MEAGADDYIRMPADKDEIISRVNVCVERQGYINGLKKAEADLRLYAEIIHNIAECVILIRVGDATVVYTNPKFEKVFGYGPGELIGKNISVVNAPTDKSPKEVAEEIKKLLREKGVWQGEVYNIKKDGTPFWCYASVSKFSHDEYGEVWVAVHTDITERKKAEEELSESAAVYRVLVETTDTGYVIIDGEGRVADANKEYIRLTGHMGLDEIRGRSVIEWTADYEKKKNAEAVAKCARDGYIRSLEIDYIDKHGKITPIEINATVVKRDGAPQILTLCRDITERKRNEDALRASEARYRSCLEVTGQIGWTTPADGIVDDILEWRKYTGQSIEEVKGWGWLDAIHPDDKERVAEVWKKAVATRSAYETEYRMRRYDGVYRYFLARGIPSLREDGSLREWVGTDIDITERKKAEEDLKKKLYDLEIFNKAAVDREMKMIELKKRVKELEEELVKRRS